VATAAVLGPQGSVAEVKAWDVASGRPLSQHTLPGHNVTRLALSPDGQLLALAMAPRSADQDMIQTAGAWVAIHDAATGAEKRRWQHDDHFAGLTFCSDGGTLAAVGCQNGTVLIARVATGEAVISQQGPPLAMDVAFNPAGTRLAVAGRLLIKLLDARTGDEMLTLRGLAQASANSAGFNPRVRFSPDGRRLAAICHSGPSPLSVWSVAEEAPAVRLETASQRAVIWHVLEARSAVAENNRPAAQWHLARLPARFRHGPTALAVTDIYLQLGRWDQAEAAHAQAAALLPADDDRVSKYRACFRLHRGDEAGYRKACAQFFERCGASTNHEVSEEIAELCVQAPGAVADPNRIVQAAGRAQVVFPKDPYRLHLLGLAHYRAGQYPQALRRLKEALGHSQDGHTSPLTWLGLALVHQRLGQPTEARKWLDRAVVWHREKRGGPRKDHLLLWPGRRGWWWGTLSFEVLRREAEKLAR
jgi:tetratricopeptide (TPR) repeat protein